MNDNRGYVIVTDYIEVNTGKDVSDELQKIILDNPHKTIFFPDGEYVIAKPICTPANPVNAVSLMLSNFATIKAAEGWDSEEAMIRLGAAEPYNDININGSNYALTGGIIDGNGVANGVSIDSGRETRIEKLSIKHTFIGLRIKYGANNGSSDADIMDVNIVGNNKLGSIGVLVEGHDNSFTNMRIASVQIGFKILESSQFLRNIHPLYIFAGELNSESAYRDGCAFWDNTPFHTWYNNCYSDQFATGFRMRSGARHIYADCYSMWYTNRGDLERAFYADGVFNSVLRNCVVKFHPKATETIYLADTQEGGTGIIHDPMIDGGKAIDNTYKKYLRGDILYPTF